MTAGADNPSAVPVESKVNVLHLNSADIMALAVGQTTTTGETTVKKPAGTTADVSPPAVVSTQATQPAPRRSGVAAMELNNPNPQPAKIINPDGTTTDVIPKWNLGPTNPGAAAAVQQAEQNRAYQDANGLAPDGSKSNGSDGLAAANPDAMRQAQIQQQLDDPHSDLNAAIRLRAPLNNPYGYSPGWEQLTSQVAAGALGGFLFGGPIPHFLAHSANKIDSSRKSPFDIVTENGHASAYKTLSDQLRGELTTTQSQITALEAKSLKGDEATRFHVLAGRTDALDLIAPTQESALKRLEEAKTASNAATTAGHPALFSAEEFELLKSRIELAPGRVQDHYSAEIAQFAEADRLQLAQYETLKAAGTAPNPAALDKQIDRLKSREFVLDQLDTTPQAMARRAEEMRPGFLSEEELNIAMHGASTDVNEVRHAVDQIRQIQSADQTEMSALEARFSRADQQELARLTARRDVLTSVLPEKGRTTGNLALAAQTAVDKNAAAGGRLLTAEEERMVKEQAAALKKLQPTQFSDRARAWYGNTIREGMFNTTPLSQRLTSEQGSFIQAHQAVQGFINTDAATLEARENAARARTTTPTPEQLNAEAIERDRLRTRTALFSAGTTEPNAQLSVKRMEEAIQTIQGTPEKRALFADNEIEAMEARLKAAREVAETESKLNPRFLSATAPEVARTQYFKGPIGNAMKGAAAATLVDMGENYATAAFFHDNQQNGLGNLLNAGIFTPMAVGAMFHNKEQTERSGVGNLASKKWAQFGVLPLAAWGTGKAIDALLPNAIGTDQYSTARAFLTPSAASNIIVGGAATLPLRPGLRYKVMAGAVGVSMLVNYFSNSGDDHYQEAHSADDATAKDLKDKSGSSALSAIDKWDQIGTARSQYIADRVQVFGNQHAKDQGSQILDDRRTSVVMRTALGEVMLQKGFSNAIAPNADPKYRDEGFSGDPMQLFTRSIDSRDSTQQIQDANHILAGLNVDLGSQALNNFQMSLANIQKLEAADPSQTSGLEDVKARISKSMEKIYGAHDVPKVVTGLISWIDQGVHGKDAEQERESIGTQIQAQEKAIQQGQQVDQRALAKECRDYALISVALAKSKTGAGSTNAAGFFNDVNNYLAKAQQYYPQDNADVLAIQQINGAAAARGSLNNLNSKGSPLSGL